MFRAIVFDVLPTFFVIGAAKCGTTSLHSYLGQHPEIHMSPVKEPCFFLEDDPARPIPWKVGNRDDWERLFDSDAPVRGESSTTYSQYPWWPGVPERMHRLVPDAKLVYLVGDPIYATVSHYMQHVTVAGETVSLYEALGDIEAFDNRYTCTRRYATQIDQYLRYFPRANLLVLDQDELRSDRRETLRQIFAFLEVDRDYDVPEFKTVANVTEARRNPRQAYVRLQTSAVRTVVDRLPATVRRPLVGTARRALSHPPMERPQLDAATRARLAAVYRGEVDRLREMTGKPFSSWSL